MLLVLGANWRGQHAQHRLALGRGDVMHQSLFRWEGNPAPKNHHVFSSPPTPFLAMPPLQLPLLLLLCRLACDWCPALLHLWLTPGSRPCLLWLLLLLPGQGDTSARLRCNGRRCMSDALKLLLLPLWSVLRGRRGRWPHWLLLWLLLLLLGGRHCKRG